MSTNQNTSFAPGPLALTVLIVLAALSRLLPLTDAGSADRRNILATLENIETVQRHRRRKHALLL